MFLSFAIQNSHAGVQGMCQFKRIQAQRVKRLPTMQETGVRSLGQEDPLEKEGDGNSLQYSCLENPTDGRVWQATVHGVAKIWTRLSNFTFFVF